jgi:hypothetical protein
MKIVFFEPEPRRVLILILGNGELALKGIFVEFFWLLRVSRILILKIEFNGIEVWIIIKLILLVFY